MADDLPRYKTKKKLLSLPKYCDFCSHEFNKEKEGEAINDANTKGGTWAWLCDKCFETYAGYYGIGLGQRYEYNKEADAWVKTRG